MVQVSARGTIGRQFVKIVYTSVCQQGLALQGRGSPIIEGALVQTAGYWVKTRFTENTAFDCETVGFCSFVRGVQLVASLVYSF